MATSASGSRLSAPWLLGIAAVLLATLPLFKLPAFYESFLYLILHWIALATSWNILSGYSGYFSFGHGAFFGLGMYTTGVLSGKLDWPFLATLPVAALVAALFGIGLGAVVFRVGRLRGELFALITLAVTFVIATIALNTPIDGGPGVYLSSVPVPTLGSLASSSTFYLLALAVAFATLFIAYYTQRAKLGLGLFAIHDDEDAAEVMGVPTYRYKLIAFCISCGLAGIVGGIHAVFVSYVTVSETFSILVPLYVVLMSVLGGTRHWLGPALGAAVVTVLLYAFTGGEYAVLGRAVVGLILVVVILFLPNGVLGALLSRFKTRTPITDPIVVEARAALAPAITGVKDDVLLQATAVSKSFQGVRALDNVSFDIRRGEILGLVGPNGSGKSTFINCVSGHYRATSGRIRFSGVDIAGLPAHRIAQRGIARTYQIPRPFPHLSVLGNVTLTAMFGATAFNRRAAEAEAMHWLAFAGLADKARALPGDLNLHERKFLEMARALASRPSLVLLDEVLSGLTPSEIDDAIRLIRSLRDQGATIVFVEHVMRAVTALSDRIAVLNQGKLIAIGDPRAVMRDPEVVRAYLGQTEGAAHA